MCIDKLSSEIMHNAVNAVAAGSIGWGSIA